MASQGIYTTEMGKHYKPEFPPPFVMYLHQPTTTVNFPYFQYPNRRQRGPQGLIQEGNTMKTVELKRRIRIKTHG